MPVRIVQLGSKRAPGEGLRIGTVRRPPRGVKKEDYARENWYDVWLPELAPSQELVSWALSEPWTDARWKRYEKAYVGEMKEPPAQRVLGLLAALSKQTDFSVGCYCDDGTRCHRRILRELRIDAGAEMK